jgi:hypothetical protein
MFQSAQGVPCAGLQQLTGPRQTGELRVRDDPHGREWDTERRQGRERLSPPG